MTGQKTYLVDSVSSKSTLQQAIVCTQRTSLRENRGTVCFLENGLVVYFDGSCWIFIGMSLTKEVNLWRMLYIIGFAKNIFGELQECLLPKDIPTPFH